MEGDISLQGPLLACQWLLKSTKGRWTDFSKGFLFEIILDDFLIHGKGQSKLDANLRRVLDRSREEGLKFNPKKVKLRVPEVSYVGHLYTSEGLKPNPEKIRAINEIPLPEGKEGVLRLLGIINYLDKFILTAYPKRCSMCLGETTTSGF